MTRAELVGRLYMLQLRVEGYQRQVRQLCFDVADSRYSAEREVAGVSERLGKLIAWVRALEQDAEGLRRELESGDLVAGDAERRS